jgi:hypothetical protein
VLGVTLAWLMGRILFPMLGMNIWSVLWYIMTLSGSVFGGLACDLQVVTFNTCNDESAVQQFCEILEVRAKPYLGDILSLDLIIEEY